jgi:hypothetical protein
LYRLAERGKFAETTIIEYRLSFADQGKTNVRLPFPFAASKRKFAVSVFRLQKTNGSCRFPLVPSSTSRNGILETWRHEQGDLETWTWRLGDMEIADMEIETWRHGHGNMDIEKWDHHTETSAIFLNSFTVCSPCKPKSVICLFVDEETNGSYPFAHGLNGLTHLCCFVNSTVAFSGSVVL